jgi:hypothetical protein
MTATAAARLTAEQAARVRLARQALAADTLTGPQDTADAIARLAARTGVLEWHLGELLALVGQLAQEPR